MPHGKIQRGVLLTRNRGSAGRGSGGSTKRRLGLGAASTEALIGRVLAANGDPDVSPWETVPIAIPNAQSYGDTGVSFAFEAFGVRVGVSMAEANLLKPIAQRLPIGWRPVEFDALDRHYEIGGQRLPDSDRSLAAVDTVAIAGSSDYAPDTFERLLEDFLAEHAHPWLFVHAGVVGWQGQAIVLPGSSFSGKSTLVTALLGAGATYFSDEFAVLDGDGRVHPFPRRISLRRASDLGGWELERVAVPTVSMNSLHGDSLPVSLVAMLSYDLRRAGDIQELSEASATMELCRHAVAIRRRPADAFAILGRITRSARSLHGYRGEAIETAHWLVRQLSSVSE